MHLKTPYEHIIATNISVRCTLETSGSNRFATNIAVLRTLEYKIVPQLIQMSGFNSSAPQ
jgi:hypothetical protein